MGCPPGSNPMRYRIAINPRTAYTAILIGWGIGMSPTTYTTIHAIRPKIIRAISNEIRSIMF
jgi:hypothetical protein